MCNLKVVRKWSTRPEKNIMSSVPPQLYTVFYLRTHCFVFYALLDFFWFTLIAFINPFQLQQTANFNKQALITF